MVICTQDVVVPQHSGTLEALELTAGSRARGILRQGILNLSGPMQYGALNCLCVSLLGGITR